MEFKNLSVHRTTDYTFMKTFRNFYRCDECNHEWEDEWSCACNDKCPDCNSEIEPYQSEMIVNEEVLKIRFSLTAILRTRAEVKNLSDEELLIISEHFILWLQTNAEPIENLFDVDTENWGLVFPLKWTT